MSNKMPKRKRSESINNWSAFGIENDLDLTLESQKRQSAEELKSIIRLDEKQQQTDLDINHITSDHRMSITECLLKTNTEEPTMTNHTKEQINGHKLSPNSDDNNPKLRRKSNRISKPIQRSMESSTTTNTPNISVKKIDKSVNKNNLTQNLINCDSDKSIVNKTNKSDDSSNQKNTGSKGGKSLRKLQMWTNEDTKCFFEAISEHGKDFPKIQSYIAQRCEKKGIPQDMIKNYEQVRHYYYRMWHKIANSLIINEVVDKNIQEIYGLVNYGEIWKKFGSKFDNKLGHHLQQLINFGHTTFKVKGKSVRVKTPICKALKKIHKINVSENTKTNNTQNLLNLPKEVTIELHPANNESWLRVHSLSQNPRVRTKLSLQKRLSNLVEYLEKRWNPSRIKAAECLTLCGTSLPNNCQTDNQCLRIRPHSSGDLNSVSLNKSVFNSQMDLSLTAYLKTLYNDELKGSSKKSKTNKSKDKESNPNPPEINLKSNEDQNSVVNEDNICDKTENRTEIELNKSFESENKSDEDEPIGEAERSLTLLRMLEKMNAMNEEIHATDEEDDKEDDDQCKDEEEDREDLPSPETNANVCLPEPPANATLAQWLSGGDVDRDNNDVEEDNEEKKTTNTNQSSENQLFQLSAERAREGWSLKECGSMTIGELYLLFRCPKKILLEYIWDPIVPNVEKNISDIKDSAVTPIEVMETSNREEQKKSVIPEYNNSSNTDLLYKLLMAANVSLQSLKRPTNTSNSQTQKKKRIKPTPAPLPPQIVITSPINNSSQLLSNVISNTIFNDNSNDGSNKQENNGQKGVPISNNEPKTGHNFIVPKSPAPKAVNKTKSRNICGDPALIQEALRQLQSNKYTRRQRRPTPKPVFGQNKPLLPRGSPPANVVSSTSTGPVSPQQPIYVIPSAHPLHINAMSAVTSNATVLNQSLPVVNMTAVNANEFRQSMKSNAKTDAIHNTFDAILPQKRDEPLIHTNSQPLVVDRLINKIHSSNIPVIQIESISSTSVPKISSSLGVSSTQTLKQTLDYSVPKSTSFINPKTVSMFERLKNDDKNDCDININKTNDKTSEKSTSIQTIDLNSNISEALDKNNEVIISSTEDSTEKLITNPHMSSLLEISLPEPPFSENSCSGLTEYSLEKRPFERLNTESNRNIHEHSLNNDPTLPTSVSQSSSLASPPIERHKLSSPVLQPEQHWLNGESCDISLGTLLNTCESPVKTVTVRDSHSLTNDVDTNMSCLVTDNSVDLMAKFADLMGHVVDTNSKST